MISLVFAYRSTKKEADLRLFCRSDSFACYIPTEIKVEKEFWDNYQDGTRFKGSNAETAKYIADETSAIKKHVQSAINKADPSTIHKDWLKKVVHEYYNPPQPADVEVIPHSLLGYIDYYVKLRENDFDKRGIAKFMVVRRKLERFQDAEDKTFEVKDVNENFKKSFVEYSQSQSYSQNTTSRDLKRIKTICKHARIKGVPVSPELDILTMGETKTPKIYLTFDELEKIKAVDGLPDYLDNVRDWLLVSCYTGQRISDFMGFDKSMIRIENDVPILEFTQKKTKKDMAIPVLPEVIGILDKRGGEFPKPISDQRYNEWIKEVCRLAKLKERIKGKKRICIAPEGVKPTKNDYRDVFGLHPKWQLITSHVGRRSFASNYYGKLPTTFLIGITGHSTEKMFLNYIGKGRKDNALEAYQHLLKAKK